MYLSALCSAIFSSNNPKNTIIPPAAATETTHISWMGEDENREVIWAGIIAESSLVAFGLFCALFYHWYSRKNSKNYSFSKKKSDTKTLDRNQ
jgi:hypothetical protein